MHQGRAPGRVRAHVQGPPPHGAALGGEGAADRAGDRRGDEDVSGQGAEADEDRPVPVRERHEGGGDSRLRLGDLDPYVQEEEAQPRDGEAAVGPLGDEPVPGGEHRTVGRREPPQDGGGERDEREDARAEVEEVPEVGQGDARPGRHGQGEQAREGGDHERGRAHASGGGQQGRPPDGAPAGGRGSGHAGMASGAAGPV